MAFLIFCFVLAFTFQMVALSTWKKSGLRFLPLLLELCPLTVALYYGIKRPSGFLFDSWEWNVIFSLYMAAAIALGCGAAWLISALRKK